MSEISKIWYDEVRTLAFSCILDSEYVKLITIDKSKLTDSQKVHIEEINLKYYDACGMYFISNMINSIDNEFEKESDYNVHLLVAFIYSILTSQNYINLFKGDNKCYEFKTRMKLKDGLKKIIDLKT